MNPVSSLKSISVSDPVLAELMDQLANRLQAGEPVDIDDLLRAHPDRADELRRLLPAVEVLAGLERSVDTGAISLSELRARSVSDGDQGKERERLEPGLLGDFRIHREIGRGGMGIVYEADQISLGRRIALKVLPFASTLDPRQLQRFRNEAHAAAQLHHTNIVPVFATGCERGVHFYAMQFIEGQTLAQVIDELRRAKESNHRGTEDTEKKQKTATSSLCSLCLYGSKDFFKMIAHLGIQAAEALEFAHQMGIIHRDIKPANLLLEHTSPNSPLTAHPTPGANATRLASTHSPLATHPSPLPSYSSLVPHPSSLRLWITDFGLAHCQSQAGLTMTGDLLGTLRYMSPEQALAKRVVVDHRTDTYSLGATIYEMLTLQPAFPGQDRQELLRQIAFDEPKPLHRVNKSVPVELETIVLKALEKNPADRFSSAQEIADDLRRFLEDKPIRARRPTVVQKTLKFVRRHKSVVRATVVVALATVLISAGFIWSAYQAEAKQRKIAVDRTRMARKAAEEMYTEFAEKILVTQPQMTDVQREFLEKALSYFKEFAEDKSNDPESRHEEAKAYIRIGDIDMLLGHADKAEQAYRNAIPIFNKLIAEFPENPDYFQGLASSFRLIGECLSNENHLLDKLRAGQQALEIQEKLVANYPERSDFRSEMARAVSLVGHCFFAQGKYEAAEGQLNLAIQLFEKLSEGRANDSQLGDRFGNSLCMLGNTYLFAGKYEQAEKAYSRRLKLEKALAKAFPDIPVHRANLVDAHNAMGDVLFSLGRYQEAINDYQETNRIVEKLVIDFPRIARYRSALGRSHVTLGRGLAALGRLNEAEIILRKGLAVFEKIYENQPQASGNPNYYVGVHILAHLLRGQGRNEEAIAVLEPPLAKLADQNTNNMVPQNNIVLCYLLLNDRARIGS